MFDLRIGMVVEGPTDVIVLQAGLSAFLQTSFTLVRLQPETPPTDKSTGWGGVYRWCRQVASLHSETLDKNPVLQAFDLIIIHVDADVAQKTYASASIEDPVEKDLPCDCPCPPASDTANALRKVVTQWLSPTKIEPNGVVCIPSKSIEAWVVAAVYGQTDPDVLHDLECNLNLDTYLHKQPAKKRLIRSHNGRLRKNRKEYERIEANVLKNWELVCRHCPQAKQFQATVEMILQA